MTEARNSKVHCDGFKGAECDGQGPSLSALCPGVYGGDPLANVESAVKALRHEQGKKRGALHDRFVLLLDADLLGRAPERDQRCAPLAAQHGLRLIWQHRPTDPGLHVGS